MASELLTSKLLPLRVSDLKQYMYCPRTVYFQYVLPVEHKVTHKMEHGKEEHFELDRLEKRRKLVEYGLEEGERRFHVALHSERLALTGIVDLLLVTPKGYFPVEFKYSSRDPALNHKYQLTAYAMLVEEVYRRPVHTGFLYMSPGKRIFPVDITENMRLHLRRLMGAIRRMVAEERAPPRSRSAARCRDCEYRRFCADVEYRWTNAGG